MGCIFTKVCNDEHDLIEDGDCGEKPSTASRRLARAKTTLLVVEPQDAALANSSNHKNGHAKKLLASDDPEHETTFYGGGIPGTALDAARVELPEFTGARDGGYMSVNGRLRWGTRTRAGNDPLRRRKENQDSFCVADSLGDDPHVTFFSVFDGHGPEGAYVSHYVRETYHASLADAFAGTNNPRRSSATTASSSSTTTTSTSSLLSLRRSSSTVSCDVVSSSFQAAARAVSDRLTDSMLDISVSGTTAVGLLVRGSDVFVANVGDSRAVVAQFDTTTSAYGLHYETRDHKPDVADERQRIEANNGRVFEWGTFRVWLQDVDMPGLAMSRSFGDAVAKTVGVTSDPDVTIVERVAFGNSETPSFAVLATDGVWEFMTTDECIAFVANCICVQHLAPQETCDALVAEALERWNAEEDVVDDITAAVVYF